MGRAPCCDKAKVKKGPWSPEEDAALKSHIQKHGIGGNWIALPNKIGLKRCGKSCRLRWLNYLRPDIKHGGFTQDEDNLICTLYATIGSRWSIIAAQLPGRTDNDIKNYWNTKLKKKLLGRHSQQQPPPTSDHAVIMEPDLCYSYINRAANVQQQNVWEIDPACTINNSSLQLEERNGIYAVMPQLHAPTITPYSSSCWGDTDYNYNYNYASLLHPQTNNQLWTSFHDPTPLAYSQ